VSTLAPSSSPPSIVCLAHLHLELSFIVIIIAVGGLADHAKEAIVVDIEVVVSVEGTHPYLNDTHQTLFMKVLSKPMNQDYLVIFSLMMHCCL